MAGHVGGSIGEVALQPRVFAALRRVEKFGLVLHHSSIYRVPNRYHKSALSHRQHGRGMDSDGPYFHCGFRLTLSG